MTGDSNDETNFRYKVLLTDRQFSKLCKAFVNTLAANIKLSRTQLSEIVHSGEFFGRFLGTLRKPSLPLTKNVLKPLAKSILITLGLTVAESAADARIHKNFVWISNEEMEDIMKIVKSPEEFGLLIKGVSER